jgi:mannose-1-phosphate guanylyltransferase/mannose-6-phosphate isomerase
MNLINIQPVILCGGSGSRLWPLSRSGFPKQFLVLSGTTTLFQQAVTRINALESKDINVRETLVVTNEEHRFIVLDQMRELEGVVAKLLLEPVARNTAPALTLAALMAIEEGDDPILVVTPADQTVTDSQAFSNTLDKAIKVAFDGSIVILGISPDSPETGYGYIKLEGREGDLGEFRVGGFTEKPSLEVAVQYLAGGNYLWNGGMFVMRASVWLKSVQEFHPDIFAITRKSWLDRSVDSQFIRPSSDVFSTVPSESIDYAVIEKCPDSDVEIKVIPLDAGWNDLGAWDAVWRVGEPDNQGNVLTGDVLLSDTTNTLIYASNRLVSAVGLNNLVVVETADAILVADRDQSQHVKKIFQQLQVLKRKEQYTHRKEQRPWGWYDTIDEGERFKVKRIQVNPGARLSLQSHQHRAEHWVVIKGTAEITNGDKTFILSENQSTYIPLGEVHRLANPGKIPLEIIEVQSGHYLGEDDIVRIEDNYGRLP